MAKKTAPSSSHCLDVTMAPDKVLKRCNCCGKVKPIKSTHNYGNCCGGRAGFTVLTADELSARSEETKAREAFIRSLLADGGEA